MWHDCFSVFSSSGWMWSVPAALPFLSLLTARATSVSIIASIFTSSVSICPLMQYIWLWTISTAAKCSYHLFICCSCVAACLPSLSLIRGRFTCSPDSSLTVWYSGFASPSVSYCVFRNSGRGAAGSRGSIDPPLFEVPGPPMQFDPPLLTQSKRAKDCENAVHCHKVKVY